MPPVSASAIVRCKKRKPRIGYKGTRAEFKADALIDPDYTADEVEFLMAMDFYKRAKRRPFPTWVEVLDVLKSLGYRKLP